MLNVDLIMRGPRLKVERAQSHVQSLIDLSSPLSKDLYEICIAPGHTVAILAKPDCIELFYKPLKPIADIFALIIGDTLHNLRSSLDHWAAAIMREATGIQRDKRIYFPFWGEGQDYKSSRAYGAIEGAVPNVAAFIRDEIKPYPSGNLTFMPLPI
jgi:hypothetical protein